MHGSFSAFLERLLADESGIDPARFAWYVDAYNVAAVAYPRVSVPGRVVRDERTGSCVPQQMTVAEYFTALGVADLFDPANPACLRPMQYACTNALGFVGYQIGEQTLIDAGYYRPADVRRRAWFGFCRRYTSHYVGAVPDDAWRNGRTEVLYRIPGSRRSIVATDVNRWDGTFTGKNGVGSLADLKDPVRQERVMRDLLDSSFARMRALFAQRRFDLDAVPYTWSGLLAAAHLRGAGAAVDFATNGTVSVDEFGTSIAGYVERFTGFETPYDAAEPAG
jgi:hypothetical protein